MNIGLICPAPAGSRLGNRVTALRWSQILRSLGHSVSITTKYDDARVDALLALHARRSADAVARFHELYPDRPILVALTGTDLYRDLRTDRSAKRSLELANRIIVLQPEAFAALPIAMHDKVDVIFQSAIPPKRTGARSKRALNLALVGHLREEKDPFRAAEAARRLPFVSRIRILHAGRAMDREMELRAKEETQENDRYQWLGELPRWKTRQLIARSDALLLTSVLEGGANVLSEAIVCGVPILASRIASSIGVLGRDYAGFYTTGNTEELTELMRRFEEDAAFRRGLRAAVRLLRPRFKPSAEKAAWKRVLARL